MQNQQVSQSYYDILDVTPSAAEQEIHAAYLRAKEIYSSQNPELYTMFTEVEAQQILSLVEEAYSALKPERKVVASEPEGANKEFDGATLRQIREAKGISLSEISMRTKVSEGYLRAVEEADFEVLPARVFVQGYVKEIAKILQLDAHKVVKSYMNNYKRTTVGRI